MENKNPHVSKVPLKSKIKAIPYGLYGILLLCLGVKRTWISFVGFNGGELYEDGQKRDEHRNHRYVVNLMVYVPRKPKVMVRKFTAKDMEKFRKAKEAKKGADK